MIALMSLPAAAADTGEIWPIPETRASATLPVAGESRAAISAFVRLTRSTGSGEPVPSSRPRLPASSAGTASPPAARQ